MHQQLPPTNKSLGQHWLTDADSLTAICNAANLQPSETVLEIGPGPGALTRLLVDRAAHVVAVEFDQALAKQLPQRVTASNLEVVQSDILSFDFTTLPVNYKVVANIPYYLTSNLLRVLSETPNRPLKIVLLIQKEVAERAAAAPGAMSLLSVSAQYYWQVELGIKVPAESFTPPPKVDSQVLILSRREKPLFGPIDERAFFRVVKAGFSQKRKTILNSLAGGLQLSKDHIATTCQQAGIDPKRRAQTLSLDEWHQLHKILNT